MALKTYRAKRDFRKTPEPRGGARAGKGNAFVIQKHAARRLHYDLRLELDGVMLSWAVTRGPSLVPGDKRLAVHVEDHPIEYNSFEGTIPKGEYGGGSVLIWDRGEWLPEGDPRMGMAKGHLEFTLKGKKLKGRWHLVRMRKRDGERQEPWLLIKANDEYARGRRDPDILEENPKSVVSGRTIEQIAKSGGRPDATLEKKEPVPNVRPKKRGGKTAIRPKRRRVVMAAVKSPLKKSSHAGKSAARPVTVAGVTLTHPDRVYWADAGVTKKMLADYYVSVWKRMAPHFVDRPVALLRCPDGAAAKCFFQKHASAGIDASKLETVPIKGEKPMIAVGDLSGLIALVQAGVLELHTWGTTRNAIGTCNRLVFDLDPGPGVTFKALADGAREVRRRLDKLKLKSFLKTTGGKGLHVVVPIAPALWDDARDFAHALALSMEKDDSSRYVANMSKKLRKGRIFIDYLRNAFGATAIAPYSTRARAGATVSVPIGWEELNKLKEPNFFTLLNIGRRLKTQRRDPWAGIGRVRQMLPGLR